MTLWTCLTFPRPKGKRIINSWMDVELDVSSLDCANPSLSFNTERTILSCTTSKRITTWVSVNKRSTSRGYCPVSKYHAYLTVEPHMIGWYIALWNSGMSCSSQPWPAPMASPKPPKLHGLRGDTQMLGIVSRREGKGGD